MKINKWLCCLLGVGLLCSTALSAQRISPSEGELKSAGDRIYLNETGGNRLLLVHWNNGEEFPSLGIGHFIWYPKGHIGPFEETFPSLVRYYLSHGYKRASLPRLMTATPYAPWSSQSELFAARARGDADLLELIDFLGATKEVQVAFIFERIESSLDKMMAASSRPAHVRTQFYRVANSLSGFYALIDYVNFKGEGVRASERYKGEGWGLLQVLEGMNGSETGPRALSDFAESAMRVLGQRIENAPPERGEERWREGWMKRAETYRV